MTLEREATISESIENLLTNLGPEKAGIVLLEIPYQMVQQRKLKMSDFCVIFTIVSFTVSQGEDNLQPLTDSEVEIGESIKKSVREQNLTRADQAILFIKSLSTLKSKLPQSRTLTFDDSIARIKKIILS